MQYMLMILLLAFAGKSTAATYTVNPQWTKYETYLSKPIPDWYRTYIKNKQLEEVRTLTVSGAKVPVKVTAPVKLATLGSNLVKYMRNPAYVALTVAAGIAAEYGLQHIGGGQWEKQIEDSNREYIGPGLTNYASWDVTLSAALAKIRTQNGCGTGPWCPTEGDLTCTDDPDFTRRCTGYPGGTLVFNSRETQSTTTRPATDEDFVPVENHDFTDTQIEDIGGGGIKLETEPGTVTFPDGNRKPVGSPYDDPITGQRMQPHVQVDAVDPWTIRVTPYDTPIDANGQPETDSEGNQVPNQEAPEKSPCEINPNSIQCMSPGELTDTPEKRTETIQADFNLVSLSGSCPSDKSFSVGGMTQSISMQPVCDAAESYIKPILLLSASLAGYLIFVGGLRT